MAKEQKLYKKRYDKLIGGVCSGLADYFDIDPTIMRLGFVLLTFATYAAMVIVYIILWFVLPYDVPDRRDQGQVNRKDYSKNDNANEAYGDTKKESRKNYSNYNKESNEKSTSVLGIILIVLGLILFVRHIIPSYLLDDFIIPICLLVGGICLILTSSSRKKKEEYYVEENEAEPYQAEQEPFEKKEEADAYVYEEVKAQEDLQFENNETNSKTEDDNAKLLEESSDMKEEIPDVIILPYDGDDSNAQEGDNILEDTEIVSIEDGMKVDEEDKAVDDNVNKTYIDITRHQLNKEDKESNNDDFEGGEGEEDE